MEKRKIIIKLSSGMLIGSGNDDFKLGGVDSSTIKIDGKPYIPGSSLKGKMKYLLKEKYKNDAEYCKKIKILFGGDDKGSKEEGNIENYNERLLFSDLYVVENSESNFFEIKHENSLENGLANPRMLERTKPNLEFKGYIIIQTSTNKVDANEIIKEGLELLQNNYIGGNGSRGYGWIEKACMK